MDQIHILFKFPPRNTYGIEFHRPFGRVHIHTQVPGVKTAGLYKPPSLRDVIRLRNNFRNHRNGFGATRALST